MTDEFLHLLLLIIIANGAPIILRELVHDRYNLAVDFGVLLPDKNPVFGPSKTWRGIAATLVTTSVAAWLLGYQTETGLIIGFFAILGDLTSSFIKRRLSMPTSSMAPLLDQIPESLFPALVVMGTFNLMITTVIVLTLIFVITELLLSHILYKLGIRKKPY